MSRRIVASHKSGSPMDLVKGIYNPPASMSKRTARRWAEVAPRLAASEESGSVPVVPENFDVLDFEVTPEKSGQSLLTFLVQNTEMDTPKVRKKLKKSDHVWVEAHGGKVIVKPRGDLRLMAGFKVHMMMMRPKPLDLNADSLEAAINKVKPGVLYKDEHIMIVNKPHGMATHGGFAPAIPNTSGAMIIARTKEAAARVSEMFRNEGQIIRMYAALTIPPLDKKVYKEGDKLQIVSGIASNGKPAPHEKMDIFDYVDDGIERKTTGGDVIKRAVTNVTVAHNQRLVRSY
nr:hypothetical protein HK105_005535 [Polyrhizophydium stewartii]